MSKPTSRAPIRPATVARPSAGNPRLREYTIGSKWFTGGVVAAPHGRIQFDFMFEGVRYRPSIRRPPSEANLRRARERLDEIKRQIELGTFSFAEEFPDYRFLRRLNGSAKVRSCNDVFDEFLAHCECRSARYDLVAVTLSSYRRILNGVWRPALGKMLFHQVRYSKLVAVADDRRWSKKTYNNAISILRRAFEFGYRNHPEQHNPARSLHSARLKKKNRSKMDPFCMQDAETLIAAIHRDWERPRATTMSFDFSPACGRPKRSRSSYPISTWSTASSVSTKHGSQESTDVRPRPVKIDGSRCAREHSQLSNSSLHCAPDSSAPAPFGTSTSSSVKPASRSGTFRSRESHGAGQRGIWTPRVDLHRLRDVREGLQHEA